MMKLLAGLGLCLGLLAWPPAPVSPALAQDGEPEARIVVAFWPTTAAAGDLGAQAMEVASAQAQVLSTVSREDFQLEQRFQVVPGMVGTASLEGIEALSSMPQVRAVALDLPVYAALGESANLIRADQAHTQYGLTGAGVNVAVLDSGVDLSHPDLAGAVIGQHCFNHGTCPPGNTDESDSAADEHGHGTHVSGIITSRGSASPRGIAPDAGIVAVRVLNDAGSGWTSDVIAGIDWVVANQARYNIRVMNLSLGGGSYPNVCDSDDANAMLYSSAVQSARQSGITVFAASGNGGMSDKMMTPACVSGAISVGSTYDANIGPYNWGGSTAICTDANTAPDLVTCTSNSSPALDLLAPGALINSAALGGGQASRSGTSMAVPHASAVAALMLQAKPSLSPDEIASILKQSGSLLTDQRNGRVSPRVDALAAAQWVSTGQPGQPGQPPGGLSGYVLLQNRQNHHGSAIALSLSPCQAVPPGNPVSYTDVRGYFTLDAAAAMASSYQCLTASQAGFLSAQRNAPSGDLGTITLPGGDVTGDNIINIFDMAYLAGYYGSNDPRSDLNGDGVVDIFDLVVAAGNYGMQGPISDWR